MKIVRVCRKGDPYRRSWLGALSLAALLAAAPGWAQEAGGGVDPALLREAESAAQQAEEAAASARSFADTLRAESGVPAANDGPPSVGAAATAVTREDLEAAVARAEAAAQQAALAARAVDKAARESRGRTGRRGAYLGGGFFYAAEEFDDDIIVKSSTGGAGYLGYRLGQIFAIELRYEGFEGFDLASANGRGEIDGFAVTVNGKAYPFRGPIQPFVTVGFGGIRLEQTSILDGGARFRSEESDGVFRFGAGVDLWLTDHIVIDASVAYLGPFDDLSNLDSTLLGTGLTYRF